MQTAAIPYRVADFLKQHPPFQFIGEADLIALASRGRVKFHEPDEYVCWQASPHTPFVFVIQQGSVSLWDETTDPPTLRDIRGPGDIIGIERFNGSDTSIHSAKTASEVVIYALQAAELEPLLARYPEAAQYVASTAAVTADYHAPGERPKPHETFLTDLVSDRFPLQCAAWTPIQQAAILLSDSAAQAIALMDDNTLAALLTPADLISWIANGAADPTQPSLNIATKTAVTLAPQSLVSDAVLAMAEARTTAAALTTDGSSNTALQSIVTTASLAPAFGDQPNAILQAVDYAPRAESLRVLNERARAWLLENLSSPSSLDWLTHWADLINRRILERLLQFAGPHDPNTLYCFYGAAGRQELLTAATPSLAIIGTAPPSLEAAFAECGYLNPKPLATASLDEWKVRFTGWITDPIRNQVYHSRPYFDLRPVLGPKALFADLESHVRTTLATEPGFLRLLAHDCLSSFPPLTFFRDLVIEESGEQTDTFRLETSALRPLVDVARVFSLASGAPLGGSTDDRFERARRLLPAHEAIFRQAADTMRLVLFHQARAGLRLGTNGTELPLATLSRQDRQLLKSGFRALHALLEFTAPCDWLEAI